MADRLAQRFTHLVVVLLVSVQVLTKLANIFNYDQNVTAGYFSYTLSLPKNYSLKAGTRYEYTTINAHFLVCAKDLR